MTNSGYEVYERDNGEWAVERFHSDRASGLFDTKQEAVAYARDLAANYGGRVNIKDERGHYENQ